MNFLKIENLVKNYAQGEERIEVLRGLNLDLPQGKTAAILGSSGSGKSTLLSLLAGLDRPDSGSIHLAGQDYAVLSEKKLAQFRAQHLSVVFQQFHLMPHLTALENVSLPLELAGRSDATSKAANLLEQVGLSSREKHFPHQLSGGEKQRVAIARALVGEPSLLLADEPSGNLDEQTGAKVMQLFFDLVSDKKATLILVTHDLKLARRCDKQYFLHHGQLSISAGDSA